MKQFIIYPFFLIFLFVNIFTNCNRKSEKESVNVKDLSENYSNEIGVSEKLIKNYVYNVDTLLVDSAWLGYEPASVYSFPYNIQGDSIYYCRNGSLWINYNGVIDSVFRFQTSYSVNKLLILKDFIIIATGDLSVDMIYIYEKKSMQLIDSIPDFQIFSHINQNICSFIIYNKDYTYNYSLFDFEMMDTTFIFPPNNNIYYFDNKFYLYSSQIVDVYCDLKTKCDQFERDRKSFIFGFFKDTYFELSKLKIQFHESEKNSNSNIIFDNPLSEVKLKILDDNLCIYGWAFDGGIFRLLRYNVRIE